MGKMLERKKSRRKASSGAHTGGILYLKPGPKTPESERRLRASGGPAFLGFVRFGGTGDDRRRGLWFRAGGLARWFAAGHGLGRALLTRS